MMKIQLLLISLFLTIAAFAGSQKNNPNLASPLVDRANRTPNKQVAGLPSNDLSEPTDDLLTSGQSPNKVFIQVPAATATPTSAPPEKKNSPPTRTPRPTTTPVPIPPAADPNATSLMILFGLIAVIVVVVGVWLNRSDR
jgi:hypothetical protein